VGGVALLPLHTYLLPPAPVHRRSRMQQHAHCPCMLSLSWPRADCPCVHTAPWSASPSSRQARARLKGGQCPAYPIWSACASPGGLLRRYNIDEGGATPEQGGQAQGQPGINGVETGNVDTHELNLPVATTIASKSTLICQSASSGGPAPQIEALSFGEAWPESRNSSAQVTSHSHQCFRCPRLKRAMSLAVSLYVVGEDHAQPVCSG